MIPIAITDCDFGDGAVEQAVLGERYLVRLNQARTREEVVAAARGAEGLFVQWVTIDDAVLGELTGLRAIVRYGIGLDNIDLAAAERRGVAVRNVDDYCIDEVAAHAAAFVVAGSRRIWDFDSAVARGEWGPRAAAAPDASDLDPVGIVGMGRIGREVARRVSAWGHPVLYWDPYLPEEFAYEGATRVDSVVDLAAEVNHLTLHVPLTDQTNGLVDERVIRALGPNGHLVNTSRGGLVDEDALIAALNSGAIGRASLDVVVTEPPTRSTVSRQIVDHPHVVATPHIAYLSTKSLTTLRVHAAKNMLELLS